MTKIHKNIYFKYGFLNFLCRKRRNKSIQLPGGDDRRGLDGTFGGVDAGVLKERAILSKKESICLRERAL